MNDIRARDRVIPLVAYGLSAMLCLAQELLYGGDTDAAIRLAQDVDMLAVHLTDIELEIRSQTMLVHAYLCLPGYMGEAYARAIDCVRRSVGTMKPKTIVGALCALSSSLAERGSLVDALTVRDIAEPLAARLLGGADRRHYALWRAGIELQCGSPSRAIAAATAIRRATPSIDRIWVAASTIQAHGLSHLGRHAESDALAETAERAAKQQGLKRLMGEAALARARNARARGHRPLAQAFVTTAIPLLDRASPTSTQCVAYALSAELTKNPLHALLAEEYQAPQN